MRWRAGVLYMALCGCYVAGFLVAREVHRILRKAVPVGR